ncbi:MAG: stage V sporulation protein AD [Lachnospiraceae bacterium]|nr:stage V sporulation protein AD [Lachnospiraceae bacterium]
MEKRIGRQTVMLSNPVYIISAASIAGKKEGEGPLGSCFDVILDDNLNNEETWEKAESSFVSKGFKLALSKAGLNPSDIDYVFAGDLLNQSSGSTFGIRELEIPFFGIFGACSTMGEGMSLGAMLIDGGFAEKILAGASSNFCAAEKQFRFPLDMGTQRPPTTTWTVTGQGSVVLSKEGEGPRITHITTGKIVDLGVKDAMNMGAAMAPAAADVLYNHFKDTERGPDYYDVIATGDLGYIGHELTVKLLKDKNIFMGENYTDCGIEIFDKQTQDTHSGGSGCACSAITFCGYYYEMLKKGKIRNILFIPTGALMSTTTSQQGESIPSIAHAITIEGGVK